MRIFREKTTILSGKRERKRGGDECKIVIFYVSVHECFNLETTNNLGTNRYVTKVSAYYNIIYMYGKSLKSIK